MKFILLCVLLAFLFCVVGTFILFVIDVLRWHDREENVEIIPSAEKDVSAAESEVTSDATEYGEYNSSTFPFFGG